MGYDKKQKPRKIQTRHRATFAVFSRPERVSACTIRAKFIIIYVCTYVCACMYSVRLPKCNIVFAGTCGTKQITRSQMSRRYRARARYTLVGARHGKII